METIYLDHAATTPVAPEVIEAMLPYFTEHFGNPNGIYSVSRRAKQALEESRQRVAEFFHCKVTEVVFTGGGSESDNMAIKGVALAQQGKGRHLITPQIEHHAVLHACQALGKQGYEVTYLPVDATGLVTPEQVREAIRDDTILVSVMYANNEVGTVEPIAEIGAVCREEGVLFHTDAVQAVGQVDCQVEALNVDLLSCSAHKLYGPKGVGATYVRRGTKLLPLIDGGGQERNRRSGTENVAGIVGMATALDLAEQHQAAGETVRIQQLRDRLIEGIGERVPQVRLNGHPTKRLPNNVNFCIQYIEGEGVLLGLDMSGICASSGSACTSGSLDPSHVLLAMGIPHERAHGSLRLSLGVHSTEAQVDTVLEVLPKVVERLRQLSPLYDPKTQTATKLAEAFRQRAESGEFEHAGDHDHDLEDAEG
ncbi:MAG: cysteine desulfurase NifS [Armatimonadetes bacterium CG17_big_fil_post_rev_8_21_14_2_50_66_6]|nr:MAG: cysteine desulfurase NifS [Armatimonadetes bacterium CG17_big_fil_post_rev_8_21_14_2_50_66_6]